MTPSYPLLLLLLLLLLSLLVFLANLAISFSCISKDYRGEFILDNPKHQTLLGVLDNVTAIPEADVSECFKLPQSIRRSGTFFRDHSIHDATSPNDIIPQFHFGSEIRPRQCQQWISADKAHYQLILDQFGIDNDTSTIQQQQKHVSFDIGANRGFYTHYLATLGMEVHAFEINPKMFNSLQHGLLFNPSNISDQVHLYSLGISDTISVYGQEGEEGGGFLKKKTNEEVTKVKSGHEIMSIQIDCFVQHIKLPNTYINFIKIDVEGFEIAVLKGAHQSFDRWTIGAMLIEVGPSRWNRADVSLESGIEEMKRLSDQHFKQSFILLRAQGDHSRACPSSLADGLLSGEARVVKDVHMYAVTMKVWEPLLTEMNRKSFDCNFWFSNA